MNIKKILLITHDASASGAPFLLLHLMELLKVQGYVINTIIHNRRGILTDEFIKISEQCVYFRKVPTSTIAARLGKRLGLTDDQHEIKNLLKDADVVFNNTLANGPVVSFIRKFYSGPLISYVHELETVTEILDESAKTTISLSDHFAVPCEAVKEHLQNNFGVPSDSIFSLNYFIPAFKISNDDCAAFVKQNQLNAAFIVGASGTVEWRKGTDIFLQVAKLFFFQCADANVQFVWMGANTQKDEYKWVIHDIEKMGLEEKVLILESSLSVGAFYKNIDVLLSTSREDPYPLVVPEAASESKPAICFSGSGGAAEFIRTDAGDTVEYLDIAAMTATLVRYYRDKALRSSKGAAAFKRYIALHKDSALIMEQFNQIAGRLSR